MVVHGSLALIQLSPQQQPAVREMSLHGDYSAYSGHTERHQQQRLLLSQWHLAVMAAAGQPA